MKPYNEAAIDMTGVVIEPEQTPISLIEGWNMIAYLRTEPAADAVFDAFTSDIVIVKDGWGYYLLEALMVLVICLLVKGIKLNYMLLTN